ncbi:MAG: hypothetical protein E7590_05555 [Ruminococcaceae bacterium]|nr:hypothetical protein [Oscillospiraceae bacterium]
MKRILCLLLVLTMLLSATVLFASCSGKSTGEPTVSKKTVGFDVAECGIYFDANLSVAAKQKATDVVNAIRDLTKVNIRAQQVLNEGEESELEEAAILIGDTGFKESNKVLKGLGDYGWAIRVVNDKLVIAGTNPFFTRVALAYFTAQYMNADAVKGSVITVNKKVEMKKIGSVAVVENDESPYSFVYSHLTDTVNNPNYGSKDPETQGGAKTDYIFDISVELRTMIANATGVKAGTFATKLDTAEEGDYEILVGNMDREEYKAELNKLAANEYGVLIKDGKVMLLAWNDVALAGAYDLFKDLITACTVEGEDGSSTLTFPANCSVVEKISNDWAIDFPKPEAADLYLDGTADVGDNSIEYIYAGSGANETTYLAYCEELEADGFVMVGDENSKPLGTDNIFRYYYKEETGTALYVYYSPYQYAAAQGVKDTLASIRVVASSTEYVDLPDESILNPNRTWTKVTESMVTSLTHDYDMGSWGIAYIMTLEDGSFIVFDGGIGRGANNCDNHVRLWNVLNSLYKKVFGTDPTAAKPIHVRAWTLSHEHADHMNVLQSFLKTYGKNPAFRFDNFLFNATSDSECYNCSNPEFSMRRNIVSYKQYVTGGFNYLKVHTGQKFYFANCEMDIMGTHEDTYPKRLEYFNNSTTTFKTILTSTDNAGNKTTTDCIWLGDLERIGSRRLRAMWGENMKADQVQVAHHGFNGCEEKLYDLILPDIVWYPYAKSHYTGSANWANSSWSNQVDHHICHEMDVKLIVMSDVYDYTLVFTTAGPQYDAIFDANDGQVKPFDNASLVDKRG